MIIHPTPIQDSLVENAPWPTIRSTYAQHEQSFVILHPFLRIRSGTNIDFNREKWPSKKDIIEHAEKCSWSKLANLTGLSLSQLDRSLGYLHCGRRTTDRDEWLSFMKTIEEENLVVAQVDYLPEILVNGVLKSLSRLGYDELLAYTDFDELVGQFRIEELLNSDETILKQPGRLETADQSIQIVTDFDQRFSYLSSTAENVNKLISEADLEGFFCSDNIKPDWSFVNQTENQIDWNSPERYQQFK